VVFDSGTILRSSARRSARLCVRLEQGLVSFIYRPFAPRVSNDQIDAFIAKGGLLIVF